MSTIDEIIVGGADHTLTAKQHKGVFISFVLQIQGCIKIIHLLLIRSDVKSEICFTHLARRVLDNALAFYIQNFCIDPA